MGVCGKKEGDRFHEWTQAPFSAISHRATAQRRQGFRAMSVYFDLLEIRPLTKRALVQDSSTKRATSTITCSTASLLCTALFRLVSPPQSGLCVHCASVVQPHSSFSIVPRLAFDASRSFRLFQL